MHAMSIENVVVALKAMGGSRTTQKREMETKVETYFKLRSAADGL